jgi:ankyrin repeat protein
VKLGTRLTIGFLAAAIAASAPAQFGPPTGDTLLQAIGNDQLDKIETIVKAQPQLVNTRSAAGQTPLMMAIDKKSIQLLGFLLFYKADPNGANGSGELPLIAAARKGWGDGVDGLLQMGAHVDGRNRQGETALIGAVQAKSPRLIRQLMAVGADPDIPDRIAGLSARDYAKRETRTPELLRLIESGKAKAR